MNSFFKKIRTYSKNQLIQAVPTDAEELIKSIPASAKETERWDKEWIVYFNTENPRPFLVDYQVIKQNHSVINNIKNLSQKEVLEAQFFEELAPLSIWVLGSDLANKYVLEIGCGPGFLGKQLGLVAKQYVGIDYSQLALSIARLVSPDNCNYIHMQDWEKILGYANSIDTMVGRFFFIHQNFDNALWLLKIANMLLKPGGVVSADFYQANPDIPQGVVFPAKSPLSKNYPSCGFEYTESEIQELASKTGFKIASIHPLPSMQRLFVRFEK
ncbi:class I SAM-dependent methyltransferase [Anabaena sp. CCY 9402-a]|uniref:class I SAM-dependent methyltransferase n=1 Tax=Anabaena sp. CCY 9402-a TaxID=3103867 RepID=UPI0039C6E5FC